jgi:predicted secreted hydrolase
MRRKFRFSIIYFRIVGVVAFALGAAGADWKTAEPGWRYGFPRDHHAHPEFKTEWWYFTGNLADVDGHRFGYEVTFFRHGIRPPAERDPNASRFIVGDLKFAHFAVTDAAGRKFNFDEKTSRGAFGEAGFDDGQRLAFIENWSVTLAGENEFDLQASTTFGALQLHLRAAEPPVVHGENGISVKAAGGGSASHYYSLPRLEATGQLNLNGKTNAVRGQSWFDHEWSSSQLGKGEVGWDWICLQWDDGAELMLYRMRLENGSVEASSSGTWIAADGTATHLRAADFQMTPTAFWKTGAGAQYPVEWRVSLPRQQLEFMLKPLLQDQELKLGGITYWEGAIEASGTGDGRSIHGRGYLELTGYAGKLSDAIGDSEGRASARP